MFMIMPEGSIPDVERSEFFERMGMGLALAGQGFDLGELLQMQAVIGPPDSTAFWDVVITQAATWFSGQSPFGDQLDPSMPQLIGMNQDVMVQLVDFLIAGSAKVVGAELSGPGGLVVGVGVDIITTTFSFIYDHNRNFGNWDSHLIIGQTWDVDYWGTTFILVYP